MKTQRRSSFLLALVAALSLLVLPALALAGPRSGGSFGSRGGFRSGGGASSFSRSPSTGGGSYGGGSHFLFFPSFGWGWGGYGMGGGFGLLGTLMVVAVVGIAAVSIARAVRRHRTASGGSWGFGGGGDDYDDSPALADRGFVYKLQVALGRSGRDIQERLESFATAGDTSTEAGLAALVQQTALELLRQKDSIRYADVDATGPLSLTNAETKMNSLTLAERSRFQVERVRAVDGRVNRSSAPAEEGREALEYVVVTLIVATRTPLAGVKKIETIEDLGRVLADLGGVSPDGMLGLEVVWTPADPNDSMTETDVMTTYPAMRSL